MSHDEYEYLRLLAAELIDGDDNQDARDALWRTFGQDIRDDLNDIVGRVFRDWL